MFRNFRKNRNGNNNNIIQNPQLQRQHYYNNQNQNQAQANFKAQSMNIQHNQKALNNDVNKNVSNNQINNFRNPQALSQQGIQVMPFDESNKQDIIEKSKNNGLQGDVIFATDEFKEKYLQEEKEIKKVKEEHKKESMKKVKFEISDIYINEINRKYFYNSLISNCDDPFVTGCIDSILKNCNKLFDMYEKERLFKDKINHTPKNTNVLYNRSMILFAIEEENKMIFNLLNELQNNWEYSKLNRLLIIKMHDIVTLNNILAYIK